MRTLLITIALVALFGAGAAGAAENGEHAAEKAPHDAAWVKQKTKTCAGCHGPKGVSQTPNFPVIAGQYRDYLAHAITGYRDGDRKNPIMAGQVKGLTDAQIEALAAYYSEQQSPLHTPTLEK